MSAMNGDMKAGLTSSRPKLSILPRHALTYLVRALEYGASKYKRGNYYGPPPAKVDGPARVMGYIDAAMRHLTEVAWAYNVAYGTDGDRHAALGVVDSVGSGGHRASGLAHLAHALASIALAIECAVNDALLPADPGQPWTDDITEERSPEAAARHANVKCVGCRLETRELYTVLVKDPACPIHGDLRPGQCISLGPVPR